MESIKKRKESLYLDEELAQQVDDLATKEHRNSFNETAIHLIKLGFEHLEEE